MSAQLLFFASGTVFEVSEFCLKASEVFKTLSCKLCICRLGVCGFLLGFRLGCSVFCYTRVGDTFGLGVTFSGGCVERFLKRVNALRLVVGGLVGVFSHD